MEMIKKGQTATEYLIILAVVIVIALVVASLLGGFPGIGANVGANANKGYWATTDIAVSGMSVSPNGSGILKIRNQLPENIKITSIETFSGPTITLATQYGVDSTAVEPTLAPGDEYTFPFNGSDGYDLVNASVDLVPGDAAMAYLRINYTDSLDATKTFFGSKPMETTVSTT